MLEFTQVTLVQMENRQREELHRQNERNAVQAVVREAKAVNLFNKEKRERK